MIRAYMIFSGSGPVLVVTRLSSGMQSESAIQYFAEKGVNKYIAMEVSSDHAATYYGTRFHSNVSRLKSEEDIRVLDINGQHIFSQFAFEEMGEPVYIGSR